jgi:AcrR family transcriptional regulator
MGMMLPAYITENDAPGKKKILEAALKLFVERGLGETTIRDIAAESGYTNPALFKHFESKEALALHLFECCYLSLFQAISHAVATQERYKKRQRAVIEALIHALHEDSAAVLFAQENLRQFWPKVSPATRKHSILGLIRKMLEEGQHEGVVTDDVEIEILTTVWVGSLQQFARIWYFGSYRRKEAKIAAELQRILMRAVGA